MVFDAVMAWTEFLIHGLVCLWSEESCPQGSEARMGHEKLVGASGSCGQLSGLLACNHAARFDEVLDARTVLLDAGVGLLFLSSG